MNRAADYQARYYPETCFGGFSDVDGTVVFFTRLHALLGPSFDVLDIGCGTGAQIRDPVPYRRGLRTLTGKCRRVIGIDPDPAASSNPGIDEFRLIEGDRWPINDEAIDLAFADNVLEHVQEPSAFFAQASRILRRGGYLCIRTPNSNSYFGLASQLVPNRFHRTVLQRVQPSRPSVEIFPTVYRCNTARKLRRHLAANGLEGCVYGYEAEPSYLGFSKLAYLAGMIHQKMAPALLKTNLFAFARKVD